MKIINSVISCILLRASCILHIALHAWRASVSLRRYKLHLERAKFVSGFSRWVKGQAQGLEPGGFKLWVKMDSTCTAPIYFLVSPTLASRAVVHAASAFFNAPRSSSRLVSSALVSSARYCFAAIISSFIAGLTTALKFRSSSSAAAALAFAASEVRVVTPGCQFGYMAYRLSSIEPCFDCKIT
jgi:hypothetical protein